MQEVKDLISRSTVNKAMKEKHSKWIDKLHNEHDKEIYTMAVRHMLDCVDEVEIDYTLTNAGRIRSMSDEELASFLVDVETHGYHDCSVSGSLEMLDWLKAEREG